MLELTDVNDFALVTPDAPLRMTVPLALQTNEHVVPVAYDGEFFLPLGRVESRSADETVIALDRLPPPLADSRSLTGAIKIFFQKVISKVVKLEFPYPILAADDVAADGTVKRRFRDPFKVRDRVAKANRILLFVHSIIGDTQSIVPSVQLARLADARPLASLYDLVLTFDYENLNTKIEENGRLFKKRLEAVGLGAGHGKMLDIAAHSMGGPGLAHGSSSRKEGQSSRPPARDAGHSQRRISPGPRSLTGRVSRARAGVQPPSPPAIPGKT